MKKLKIATIIFLIGTAICLCAILIFALSGGKGIGDIFGVDMGSIFAARGDFGSYSLVMEKEIQPENIRSLQVDYGMTYNDVFFCQGEGESIVIREYMNFTPDEDQISRVGENDGKIIIEGARRNTFLFFSFGSRDAYTEIYLPENVYERLEEVHVKTTSGKVFSDISLSVQKEFSISSTSGDLRFPEVMSEKIQISSTSGNIHMEAILGEKISASTTSGDIALALAEGNVKISSTSGNVILDRMRGDMKASTTSGDLTLGQVEGNMDISSTSGIVRLSAGEGEFDGGTVSGDIRIESLKGDFEINTTSGNISVMDGCGSGKAGTVSGDIKVFLDNLTGNLTATTTSGNVNLQLPETASLTLDFDSTSGECTTFFDDQLQFNKKGNQAYGQYGSGKNRVDVSTVSGDLRITKY